MLKDLFAPFGALRCVLLKKGNLNTGAGRVTLKTEEDMRKAIREMQGREVNDKNIVIRYETKEEQLQNDFKKK